MEKCVSVSLYTVLFIIHLYYLTFSSLNLKMCAVLVMDIYGHRNVKMGVKIKKQELYTLLY